MSESTEEVMEEIDDVRGVDSGPGFGRTSPDNIKLRRTNSEFVRKHLQINRLENKVFAAGLQLVGIRIAWSLFET
ncbi:hypothetical protein DPMN_185930 [Dreissena polymorpha]|uniref:Uncharacterized protein n=1 Tax=Dreissena polymorpha TaxID=45954 RepID=A0A9D4I624_DREPO|nr:hypothetical protein DPMN_185930 [Dreissena polymorpha]